jgi:FtsH-binding integral membrane protein
MRQEQAYGRPRGRGYPGLAVADSSVERRAKFIVRTYNHLFASILAFTAFEVALYYTGMMRAVAIMVSEFWWVAFGGFILVGWLARGMAQQARSLTKQYIGLGAIVFVWSILFAPMLYIANEQFPGAIQSAGLVTVGGFAGLTAIAFATRKDFSFLRGILMWGGICALAMIVGSAIFGFSLGVFFSVAMIALAGGSVLYDTSNVLHHFPEDRYVAAALELFASIALMFWYVLRLFMSRD